MKPIRIIIAVVLLLSTSVVLAQKNPAEDKGEIYTPEQRIMVAKDTSSRDPKFARGILRTVIKELDGDIEKNKELLIDAHFTMAASWMISKNFETAADWFSKTIELNPNHLESLSFRGRIYFILSRFSDARIDLNKALTIDPKHERSKKYLLQMDEYLKSDPDAEDFSENG